MVSSAPLGTNAYNMDSAIAAAIMANSHVRKILMESPPIQKM